MAVKSLYFKNTAPTGAATSRALQDGGTAPATGITTTGWIVARLAAPNLSAMLAGTERASGTFTTADAIPTFAASACWRTENALTGTFANTNWTLAFRVRAVSSATAQTGAIKARIWRSANADGSGATQLTSAVLTGTTTAALSTSASATSTVTWTPGGTVALSNEYLWVQCEWSIVGTATNNAADVDFYIESAGVITTSNFVISYAMPAAVSAVAVTTQPAVLRRSLILHCDTGAVALTGNAVAMGRGTTMLAVKASVVVTGNTAQLVRTRLPMPAVKGSVAVTGVDVALRRALKMLAAPGDIVVTGYAAALSAASNKHMLAATGAVTVTGNDAELIYTEAELGGYTLDAAPAAIFVSAQDAELSVERVPPPVPAAALLQFARARASRPLRW